MRQSDACFVPGDTLLSWWSTIARPCSSTSLTLKLQCASNGPQYIQHGGEPALELKVLRLDCLLLFHEGLQLAIGLSRLKVLYPLFQRLNLLLRPLSDGALGLAVVGALLLELCLCELPDALLARGRGRGGVGLLAT